MRRHVIYVSYDGATEPLGVSQVVAYLERLTEVAEITLISFEKDRDSRAAMAERLTRAGIHWIPLKYHRAPPGLSTAFDVWRGTRAVNQAALRDRPQIIHARSYVAALIARRSRSFTQTRFLFDIRGFWADERIEGGIWRRGMRYRLAKYFERRFFDEADAVVTLTQASVPQIRSWLSGRDIPVRVIPTCVDLARFGQNEHRSESPAAVWNGSIGTWYRFDLAVRMARALGVPLRVLTRQTQAAEDQLDGLEAEVRTVDPEEVPSELRANDFGLCLVQPSFSKQASAPTRFAEHLAAGNPVVALPGVGDVASVIERERVGVVLQGELESDLQDAAEKLHALNADPDVAERCKTVAHRLFSLESGVAAYRELYVSLTEGHG